MIAGVGEGEEWLATFQAITGLRTYHPNGVLYLLITAAWFRYVTNLRCYYVATALIYASIS